LRRTDDGVSGENVIWRRPDGTNIQRIMPKAAVILSILSERKVKFLFVGAYAFVRSWISSFYNGYRYIRNAQCGNAGRKQHITIAYHINILSH